MTHVECNHCKISVWFESDNERIIDVFKGQHFFCSKQKHQKHGFTLKENLHVRFGGCVLKFCRDR